MGNDGGAIYAYWVTHGSVSNPTEWSYNWLRDSKSIKLGSALYSDNNSSNVLMHHNVIWNVQEGIRVNAPAYNTKIYNNTFWDIFSNGPTLSQAGPPGGSNLPADRFVYFTNNFYNSNNPLEKFDLIDDYSSNNIGTTTPEFVKQGEEGLYFRLSNNSPAKDAGIQITGITDEIPPDAGAFDIGDYWVAGNTVTYYGIYMNNDKGEHLSLAEGKPAVGVTMFPNPVGENSTVYFDLGHKALFGKLEVFDLNGSLISSQNISGLQTISVQIKKSTAGVYIIRIASDKENITRKLLVN